MKHLPNNICQNPYCEAEATVKIHRVQYSFTPSDQDHEHYCSECIHEHVYDEHDPDPCERKAS